VVQVAATEEKTVLEEAQRASVKERKAKCEEWEPNYFEQDLISGQWVYKHSDLRPWDTRNDLFQFECDYVIQTKTRHKTPMIRTSSIISVDPPTGVRKTLCYKVNQLSVFDSTDSSHVHGRAGHAPPAATRGRQHQHQQRRQPQ
jgi:oxysterol-binding protein-related protein 8